MCMLRFRAPRRRRRTWKWCERLVGVDDVVAAERVKTWFVSPRGYGDVGVVSQSRGSIFTGANSLAKTFVRSDDGELDSHAALL